MCQHYAVAPAAQRSFVQACLHVRCGMPRREAPEKLLRAHCFKKVATYVCCSLHPDVYGYFRTPAFMRCPVSLAAWPLPPGRAPRGRCRSGRRPQLPEEKNADLRGVRNRRRGAVDSWFGAGFHKRRFRAATWFAKSQLPWRPRRCFFSRAVTRLRGGSAWPTHLLRRGASELCPRTSGASLLGFKGSCFWRVACVFASLKGTVAKCHMLTLCVARVSAARAAPAPLGLEPAACSRLTCDGLFPFGLTSQWPRGAPRAEQARRTALQPAASEFPRPCDGAQTCRPWSRTRPRTRRPGRCALCSRAGPRGHPRAAPRSSSGPQTLAR